MQGSLYGWQRDALDAWHRSDRVGIVQAVTGTGKTRVGQEAIAEAVQAGRRSVVLVPTQELQTQWVRSLRAFDHRFRIGQAGGGSHDSPASSDVTVAIVNTARTWERVPQGSLLVADECHRYAADTFQDALRDEYDLRLGLTATLERADHREIELVQYFGPIVHSIDYPEALADAIVAQFSVALVGVPMTRSERTAYEELSRKIGESIGALSRAGVPTEPFHNFLRVVKRLSEDSSNPSCWDAREFLGSMGKRRSLVAQAGSKLEVAAQLGAAAHVAERTIVFTDSKDAAESLARTMSRRWRLPCQALHSDYTATERKQAMRDFERGRIRILVAPRILDEGIDVPAADLAIVVSASSSRRQMVQRMGRVLRRKGDDRLARFVVVYLEGTTEDPSTGAHEAYLQEMLSVAADIDHFRAGHTRQALTFLAEREPWTPSKPPRLEGEAPRQVSASAFDSDAVDAMAFFGLSPATALV